jgi:hypothetical protein
MHAHTHALRGWNKHHLCLFPQPHCTGKTIFSLYFVHNFVPIQITFSRSWYSLLVTVAKQEGCGIPPYTHTHTHTRTHTHTCMHMHLFFTSPSSVYLLWCLGPFSPPPEHGRHGVQARVKRPKDRNGKPRVSNPEHVWPEYVQALGAWERQAGVRAGLRPQMCWCMPEQKQTRK